MSCTTAPRPIAPSVAPPPIAVSSVAPPAEPPPTDTVPHGDCSQDGWCWDNPLPCGDELRAVWGSAPNDYWAGGKGGALLHFDGSGWSRVEGATSSDVRQLFGRGQSDVWALGVPWSEPLRHWDGAAWSRPALPPSPRVGGFGENGTPWVIDDSGGVWRFDGSRWKARLPASCHADGCGWYTARTASGGTLTGRPTGADWDGTHTFETRLPAPTGRTFGGTRESHVLLLQYATGGYVEAWSGGRWVEQPVPDATTPREQRPVLRSVWGATDDNVWAVGDGGALAHFDGNAWTAFDSGTRANLTNVWGTSRDDVWTVGGTALIHWDGHAWAHARATVTENALNAVWALGGCAAFVAGDAGTVLRRDCKAWQTLPSGLTSDLLGVWASDANNVWLVGTHGTLLHFDGRTFEPLAPLTDATLRDVWGTGPRNVWVVGDDATTLHFDGERWQKAPNPFRENQRLFHVRGTAPDHVVVVGERGAFAVWDGRSFTHRPGPPCWGVNNRSDTLNTVLPLGVNDWWVACDQGGLQHGVLGAWVSESTSTHLNGLARVESELFAVGPYQLWQRTAEHWRLTSTRAPFRALAAAPDGRLFAVGEHGVISSRAAD